MRSVISAIAAVLLSAHAAAAQNFPNRSLTLVVAAAAGGTTDVLARIVAKRMGEDLGQSVVVENVPGGGATVGTRRVVRSDADGYTLIFGNMGSLAANVWLFPQLGFDPRKDLAPVGLVAVVPMVLSVSKKSGIRDLPALSRRFGRSRALSISAMRARARPGIWPPSPSCMSPARRLMTSPTGAPVPRSTISSPAPSTP